MKRLICAALAALCLGSPAKSQFVGKLVLGPSGCKKTGQCVLQEDFGYVDIYDYGWQADKGDVTDGASIPDWAQKFVGVPFREVYLPAAVLHDQYSKGVRPVYGWLRTQRMFYEVLKASKVKEPTASIMYAGVLIGSRKWLFSVKPEPCDIGKICYKSITDSIDISQAASFGTDGYKEKFAMAKARIEAGETGRDAVEKVARSVNPNDIYMTMPEDTLSRALIKAPDGKN